MTSLLQNKEMLAAKQNHEEEFHQSYHKKNLHHGKYLILLRSLHSLDHLVKCLIKLTGGLAE